MHTKTLYTWCFLCKKFLKTSFLSSFYYLVPTNLIKFDISKATLEYFYVIVNHCIFFSDLVKIHPVNKETKSKLVKYFTSV